MRKDILTLLLLGSSTKRDAQFPERKRSGASRDALLHAPMHDIDALLSGRHPCTALCCSTAALCSATTLLSQILSSLKDKRLPEKTLESLAQFFADRLVHTKDPLRHQPWQECSF